MLNPDYKVQLPQISRLNDRDIAVIRRGFDAVENGADDEILSKIAYKVSDVLGLERARVGSVETFLRTVLNDYEHLALSSQQPSSSGTSGMWSSDLS